MLLRVDRCVRAPGRAETCETRYFITSIPAEKVTPRQLLQFVRGHWQIENSLHFVKDRWWDEDRHWLKRPGLAERLAALLDSALTFLRICDRFDERLSLRARAENLHANPALALNLIGAQS